jgi:hypothetical protein
LLRTDLKYKLKLNTSFSSENVENDTFPSEVGAKFYENYVIDVGKMRQIAMLNNSTCARFI